MATRALQLNSDLADSHVAPVWPRSSAIRMTRLNANFAKLRIWIQKLQAARALGLLFNITGKTKQAEGELARALVLNPQDSLAHMNLGLLYYKTARYPEAAAAWKK